MKNVSISECRRLANETDATRMLIIAVDDDGNYAFTTFGKTKAQCRAMAEWADREGIKIAMDMP
jgi:hypothetical protein